MSVLANEADFYFDRGGPSDRLLRRMPMLRCAGSAVGRCTLFLLGVTWVPFFVGAWFDGRLLGSTANESMLFDFATYARFFLSLPLTLAADIVVGPRLRTAGLGFVRGGFVRQSELPLFVMAIERVKRRREALAPELVIAVIALLGAMFLTVDRLYDGAGASWKSLALPDGRISLAGSWYHLVAIPILQFVYLRWMWRLAIWYCFLYEMSRLDLNLVATHADGAGGLGFLGVTHGFLGIFGAALGAVLSADAGYRIVFNGVAIQSFQSVFIAFLAGNLLLFVAPLFVFSPRLFRARLEGLRYYSALTTQYNRAFQSKWIDGDPVGAEPLLGTADIQSLADLANSFDRVRAMKTYPFDRSLLFQIALSAALPALPLVPLVIPIVDLIKLLGGAILK